MWEKYSSPAGLEPALPKGNGLAGHRVNHSAKVTSAAHVKSGLTEVAANESMSW